MKIAIIGAGFTGLSAAHQLAKKGHYVFVFEKNKNPGGLAIGFKEKNWDWTLEEHYHHWFTNDKTILNLAKEINHEVIIKRPKTSTLINGIISQLDSPFSLIKFPLLNLAQKTRMGLALASLRCNPFWKPFDKYKAYEMLPKMMGQKGFQLIWEPLFKAKFRSFAKEVSLAWFWARIRKRTSSLAYPKGGFLEFTNHLTRVIKNEGTVFHLEYEVEKLESNKKVILHVKNKDGKKEKHEFDKIIVTLPSFLFLKIAPGLPDDYRKKLENLKSLGATNLFLRLKKPFLTDGTYWLNVCEKDSLLMAVVEHTNFMDKKYYDNEHLVYIGHYLPRDHPYFFMTKEELLKKLDPYLRKLNKDYRKNLIGVEFFKAPFAQPIAFVNYQKMIPPFETPLNNVYLANIDQVYPWDRGTSYAVELGIKISKFIEKD